MLRRNKDVIAFSEITKFFYSQLTYIQVLLQLTYSKQNSLPEITKTTFKAFTSSLNNIICISLFTIFSTIYRRCHSRQCHSRHNHS